MVLLGVLLGLAAERRDGPGDRPPAVWVADRDGQKVVGLDRDLVRVTERSIRWPLEIEGRRDRRFWVLRAAEGTIDGGFELSLHAVDGNRQRVETFGPLLDLATLDGADALAVEMRTGEPTAVWRVRADGARWIALQVPDVRCAAGRSDRILAGTDQGKVLLADADGTRTVLDQRYFDLQIIDVAPGPPEPSASTKPAGGSSGLTWWVLGLDAQGLGRLLLLDAELEPRWEAATELRPRHLVPVPGREQAWVADITAPRVRRFGPGGVLEVDRDDLQLLGFDRGAAWPDGGVVLTAPGTLLRLDANGDLLPSQGAFAYPVDLTQP